MNSETTGATTGRFSACSLATLLLGTGLAVAKSYDIAVDTVELSLDAIEQPMPAFPADADMRKGQEGWVQVNFVVDADGRVADPIVVDSTGGAAFADAAIDAMAHWRFKAPDAEVASNTVAIRFEQPNDSGKASRGFTRWYRLILTDLASNKIESARENLDRTREFGGWNLYETTILEVVAAQVAEMEGKPAEQLRALRRAMHIGNEAALTDKMQRKILSTLVRVETSERQFAAAQRSLEQLKQIKGSASLLEELAEEVEALYSLGALDDEIEVAATLDKPCDCDDVAPLWVYEPLGRQFSFDAIEGELERFEARCDGQRLNAAVETSKAYAIPDDWGDCEVFVFGSEGSSFRFVEHMGHAVAELERR